MLQSVFFFNPQFSIFQFSTNILVVCHAYKVTWLGIDQNLVTVIVRKLLKIVHKEAKIFKFCSKVKLSGSNQEDLYHF